MLTQITAIVAMNIRSIPQRFWMSFATMLAVAIVVAVLLAFQSMGDGFRATLQGSGSDQLAIIMRVGAQSELNSTVSSEQVNLVSAAPSIERDEEGAIISAELYLVVDAIKKSSRTEANIPLRGLDLKGAGMRENVQLLQGRMFEPGKNEIVVGEAILREFEGFELGKTVKLGKAHWDVVGVFGAGASVFSSELWTDARTLQSQFDRGNYVQIVRAKLASGASVEDLEHYFKTDKRLNLEAKTEKNYYQDQSKGFSDIIFYMGLPLSIVMAFGALSGALNTMYNSVAQRTTEIATLRALGFSGVAVFLGTLIESFMLSVIGGLLGAVAAFIFFDGLSTSTLGGSFTQIVFNFQMTSQSLIGGLVMATLIGFIGGFFPALRAANMPVAKAFTSAP